MDKYYKHPPLVSVITSVLNGGKYFEKTIDSVRKQTYSNIEYIVIDGGSTDETLAIIKKSDVITRFISEKDTGIYNAWNKGLAIATGEFVSFLGADDEFYPEAIEQMINVTNSFESQLDYIAGRTNLFKDGKLIKTSGIPYDWKLFRRYVCTGHNGALHHRSLYQKYGKYDESYRSAADYELLLRAGKRLKAGYTHYITTKMNLGGASNSSYKPILEAHNAIFKHSDEKKLYIFLQTFKALAVHFTKRILSRK